MRKVGIIGGLSWESTLLYYKNINELTQAAKIRAEIDCMYVREGIKLPEEVGI